MGDVRDAIKRKDTSDLDDALPYRDLLGLACQVRDGLSACARTKDEDALSEGEAYRVKNMQSAAALRAAHALMTTVCAILEDY